MSLSRLRHSRMLWIPGFLALWLLAWSVALADPCIVQIPAVGHAAAPEHPVPAYLHGHGDPTSHTHAEPAPHDHSECDHALEHSGESVLLKQVDQGRGVSLGFLVVAVTLAPPPVHVVAPLRPRDRGSSAPPPLPVYLNTARLRI